MAAIGLFGDEYDECVGLLKARLEDLGHTARVINLRRFPLVTRGMIDGGTVVHDGIDLLSLDAFYLRELGGRDPFFHVQYTPEFWTTLRERYLAFEATEVDNAAFESELVAIVARRRPMINAPRVYEYRRALLHELDVLARHGIRVARHAAVAGGSANAAGIGAGAADERLAGETIRLDLDEDMTWDVLAFPKGVEKGLEIRTERIAGDGYTLIVVGDRVLDCAFVTRGEGTDCAPVERSALPAGVERTALDAARVLGAEFAEVELRLAASDGGARVVKVDTSPYFAYWERGFGARIAAPLAAHIAARARAGRGDKGDS